MSSVDCGVLSIPSVSVVQYMGYRRNSFAEDCGIAKINVGGRIKNRFFLLLSHLQFGLRCRVKGAVKAANIAHIRCRDSFGLFVENDLLDIVTDITSIKYIGDIRKRHYNETSNICRQRRFDPLLHCKERKWIFPVNTVCVADRHANLSYPLKPNLDQPLMARMERLISSDEQGCWFLRIERRAEQRQDFFRPIFG
jgi:hypothetical protein